MINYEKYYSICCGVLILDYPDSDFCPRCRNHTDVITEEQYKKEGEVNNGLPILQQDKKRM